MTDEEAGAAAAGERAGEEVAVGVRAGREERGHFGFKRLGHKRQNHVKSSNLCSRNKKVSLFRYQGADTVRYDVQVLCCHLWTDSPFAPSFFMLSQEKDKASEVKDGKLGKKVFSKSGS